MQRQFIIAGIALIMALAGCQHRQPVQAPIALPTHADSVQYAFGYRHGAMIRSIALREQRVHSKDLDAIEQALVQGTPQPDTLSEWQHIGQHIGCALQDARQQGLANNIVWRANERLFFAGLIAGAHVDTTFFLSDSARLYLNQAYLHSTTQHEQQGVLSRFGMTATDIDISLSSAMDSVNYCFGYCLGQELLSRYDSIEWEQWEAMRQQINIYKDSTCLYSSARLAAQELGERLRQESQPQRIRQGFADGLRGNNALLKADEIDACACQYMIKTDTLINTNDENEKD